jgi:hypothetical protein
MAGYALALRHAQLDAITTRAGNAAILRAYSGTQPATGGAATTLLAEWTMGTPFAAAASGGALSVTLPADTTGVASGQCTWLRLVQSDGTTHVMDIPASQVTMNTTNITAGQPAKILGFTITAGNA